MTVYASENVTEKEYTTEQIENVENKVPENTQSNTTTPTTTSTNSTNSILAPTGTEDLIDPNVTIDDLGNKVLNKLYQIANLLKQIAAPVSIITFVIGAIMAVIGAFGGRKDGPRGGILVCVLSIIMYAVCMYAEPIILAVSKWLVS